MGGTGGKPSHQWGPSGARLGGGRCGVHVTKESLDLPQGDSPTSVTHLGETDVASVLMPPPPRHPDLLVIPILRVFSEPISRQEGSPHPTALWPPNQGSHTLMDRSSSPKATMTLIGGRTRLDSWLSTVARMAFCGVKGGRDE